MIGGAAMRLCTRGCCVRCVRVMWCVCASVCELGRCPAQILKWTGQGRKSAVGGSAGCRKKVVESVE